MKVYPDIAKEYCDQSGRVRTPKTREQYLKILRMLQHRHPLQAASSFTTQQLTEFCTMNDPSPATQKQRRAIVRSIFDWAEYRGYVKKNPATALKYTVAPGNFQVRSHTWLTEAQVGLALRQ